MPLTLPGIRNRIECELQQFVKTISSDIRSWALPDQLGQQLNEFILRGGKRLRPLLFICSFCGFGRPVAGLYRSAIGLELLHNFVLIHDDIIDETRVRRGRPAMHVALNSLIPAGSSSNSNGRGMGIVVGDMLYAAAIDCFLGIRQESGIKHRALKMVMNAAVQTGAGQLKELFSGFRHLAETRLEEVYRIYDLKTSHYSFVIPLTVGAFLAKAESPEIKRLGRCGQYLGRAYQILDDLESLLDPGPFNSEGIGDLSEGKITLPLWYAYHKSGPLVQKSVRKIIDRGKSGKKTLLLLRELILQSGAVEFAKREMRRCGNRADPERACRNMSDPCKLVFLELANEILAPKTL